MQQQQQQHDSDSDSAEQAHQGGEDAVEKLLRRPCVAQFMNAVMQQRREIDALRAERADLLARKRQLDTQLRALLTARAATCVPVRAADADEQQQQQQQQQYVRLFRTRAERQIADGTLSRAFASIDAAALQHAADALRARLNTLPPTVLEVLERCICDVTKQTLGYWREHLNVTSARERVKRDPDQPKRAKRARATESVAPAEAPVVKREHEREPDADATAEQRLLDQTACEFSRVGTQLRAVGSRLHASVSALQALMLDAEPNSVEPMPARAAPLVPNPEYARSRRVIRAHLEHCAPQNMCTRVVLQTPAATPGAPPVGEVFLLRWRTLQRMRAFPTREFAPVLHTVLRAVLPARDIALERVFAHEDAARLCDSALLQQLREGALAQINVYRARRAVNMPTLTLARFTPRTHGTSGQRRADAPPDDDYLAADYDPAADSDSDRDRAGDVSLQ